MTSEGDECTIEPFVKWLCQNFPRLEFGPVRMSLKKAFPKPKDKFLIPFWKNKNAHLDIPVFRHGKLVCAIEPGGSQHLTDERQMANDKRKAAICKENDVNFLPLLNSCLKLCGHKEFKKLLKCYFYRKGY